MECPNQYTAVKKEYTFCRILSTLSHGTSSFVTFLRRSTFRYRFSSVGQILFGYFPRGTSSTSWFSLATNARSDYSVHMLKESQALSSDELRERLRPFC